MVIVVRVCFIYIWNGYKINFYKVMLKTLYFNVYNILFIIVNGDVIKVFIGRRMSKRGMVWLWIGLLYGFYEVWKCLVRNNILISIRYK